MEWPLNLKIACLLSLGWWAFVRYASILEDTGKVHNLIGSGVIWEW